MQVHIPTIKISRAEQQQQHLNELKKQLSSASIKKEELSPPLQLLWEACRNSNTNFERICVDFLQAWFKEGEWLYPQDTPLSEELKTVFAHMDFFTLSEQKQKGCVWSSDLVTKMEEPSTDASELILALEELRWPFVEEIKKDPNNGAKSFILASFTKQIFAIANELPAVPLYRINDPQENAHLFSSYCRAYDINLPAILPMAWDMKTSAN